jgi:RNA polymerase sigma factor (sigma-70 family)
MDEPSRTQWQIRCAFNGFCKRALKHEAINAHKQTKRQQLREVTFSDLAPREENQLYTLDTYFENEVTEAFNVGGKKITPKLLSDALHSLPEDKRKAVLLYYFFEMSDVEIGELLDIPRSTVQYRRTSSFELLKQYLEENADERDEW